ncbi:MAG: hypothetical protein ABSC60_01270 [Acidobacteriota bacterium]
MKKFRIPIALFWLAFLPAAYSQQKGIAEGRLIDLTDPAIILRGVELEVIELGGGMSIIKSATTDASGKFRIERLPEDQKLMIRADYKGASYHGQLTFSAGKASLELGVYEPTTSMKDINVEADHMAFEVVGDQLRSLETVTFNNKTKPPRTFTSPDGNFRISKPDGIIEPPQIRVAGPGSSMPLVQSALESADGKSYYSRYPLRPGITTFEVQELLPYSKRSYTYIKHFYHDVGSIDVGVIPQDMVLSGKGLSKIQTDPQKNFSVYASTPVKAGTEVAWQFSGGTAVQETESPGTAGEPEVSQMPNAVGRNALIIGSLLLMGFILVLWYAFNRSENGGRGTADFQLRHLKDRREQLLNSMADLVHRHEAGLIGGEEFLRQREEGKRRLRRISQLLKIRDSKFEIRNSG